MGLNGKGKGLSSTTMIVGAVVIALGVFLFFTTSGKALKDKVVGMFKKTTP